MNINSACVRQLRSDKSWSQEGWRLVQILMSDLMMSGKGVVAILERPVAGLTGRAVS